MSCICADRAAPSSPLGLSFQSGHLGCCGWLAAVGIEGIY